MKDLWALQWEQKLLQEGRAANEWPSGGYGDITCHFSREFSSAREQYGKERTGQGHHRLQHGEREEERRQSPREGGGRQTEDRREDRERASLQHGAQKVWWPHPLDTEFRAVNPHQAPGTKTVNCC